MKEPCKKAKNVKSLEELGLSQPAKNLVRGIDPEELILSVRNHEIYKFLQIDNDLQKKFLVDEIEAILRHDGFIREDISGSLSPEIHFSSRYVCALHLMEGHEEKCVPFYDSNEAYENYVFSLERLDKILAFLERFLTEKNQFEAVKSDLYSSYPLDGMTIRAAKSSLCRNKKLVSKDLFRIFA